MAPPPKKNRKHLSANALQADEGEKSPQRKCVRFFEKSRHQWKAKCLDAKATVKGRNHRRRFFQRSTAHWQSQGKEREEELARVKAQEHARERAIEAVKKSIRNQPGV